MVDPEKARAQSEAVDSVVNRPESPRRAQIWGGLMRYLASESQRLRTRPETSSEQKPRVPGQKPRGRDERSGGT